MSDEIATRSEALRQGYVVSITTGCAIFNEQFTSTDQYALTGDVCLIPGTIRLPAKLVDFEPLCIAAIVLVTGRAPA